MFVPGVTKEAIAMKCFHYYLLWNHLYFLNFPFHSLEKVPCSVCTIHEHEVRWSLLSTNLCRCTFLCRVIAKHEAVIIYSSASPYNCDHSAASVRLARSKHEQAIHLF